MPFLGFGLGILGAITAAKDISYTIRDEKIGKAKRTTIDQKNQIDAHFIDILKCCGAYCKIKGNNISNVERGKYGRMERYLFEKGFKKESIEYCKNKFDNIAEKQQKDEIIKAKERIEQYEAALRFGSKDVVITIDKNENKSQSEIEEKVNKLIRYFNTHNNNVDVNIIWGGRQIYHSHTEVWHIKEPKNHKASKYYHDVCTVLEAEPNFPNPPKTNKSYKKRSSKKYSVKHRRLRNGYTYCENCGHEILDTLDICPFCDNNMIKISSYQKKSMDNVKIETAKKNTIKTKSKKFRKGYARCNNCGREILESFDVCPFCDSNDILRKSDFKNQDQGQNVRDNVINTKNHHNPLYKTCPKCGKSIGTVTPTCPYCGNREWK